MPKSKIILVVGGIALAAGAIWYIKKSEKPPEEFIPVQGPKTYYGSQEASGSFFNPQGGGGMGGGGAPSAGAPGVTVAPPEDHTTGMNIPPNTKCPPGKTAVGISAIAGKPGGIKCV